MGLFGKKKKEKVEEKKVEKKEKEVETTTPKASSSSKTTTAKSTKTAAAKAKVETETKTDKEETVKSEPAKKTGKKPIYRVLYDKEARVWVIKKDGAKRTIASYVTKEEALNRVKELSSSNDLNFIVHKKDGKFQKK